MKKFLTIILTLLTVIGFSACKSGKTSVPEIAQSFSASAEFVHNDKTSTGILTRNGTSWTLEMTAPEEIKGVKFSIIDGKSSTSLGKLQVEGGQAENNFLLLVAVLEFASNEEGVSASKSNGKITATGRTITTSADKNFELLFNAENQPEQLKIGSANLTVNISGVTMANADGEPNADADDVDDVDAQIDVNNESLEK